MRLPCLFVVQGVLFTLPCIGQIAGIGLAVVAWTFLTFGLFLIVDRKMEFWPASMESFNIVKTNFWPFLGLSLIASIIGSIGAILCGIGLALTLPVYYCIMTVAYRAVFNGRPAPFTPIIRNMRPTDRPKISVMTGRFRKTASPSPAPATPDRPGCFHSVLFSKRFLDHWLSRSACF